MKLITDPAKVHLVNSMGDYKTVVDAARVSIGGQKPISQDMKLLKYLWKNGHTSPFEHVTMTVKIECPIFTARQIMRHRTFSYNEISGRYSELDGGYYVPVKFYPQNEENKQGVKDTEMDSSSALLDYMDILNDIDELYRRLINDGVSREQARYILPVSTITSFYMTGNLLNWTKFLKLRLDDHAQYEVWAVALLVAALIGEIFPKLWEVIEESCNGTNRQMAQSRNLDRALQEGGFS